MRPFVLGLLSLVACSSSSSSDAAPAAVIDAGPPTVSTEACSTRCVGKAASCGAPVAQAQTICASICAEAVTEAQAACLEAKACGDLIAAAGQGSTLEMMCPGLGPAPDTGPTSVPAQLTIAAAIPDGYRVNRTIAGDMRSSLFNVSGPALFVPAAPLSRPPRLTESTEVTVVSPPRNGCESVFNVTMALGQLAVSTSAVDVLPDTKCTDFIDAVAAQGVTLTLRDVPWPGSEETSTVTVVLRRLSND